MNWQNNFTAKILARGLEYYENGNVFEILKTASGYEAEVKGTSYDTYHVIINIENDEIKDMNCTCIYGQEIGYCKHMAAVLYAVDEEVGIEEELNTKDIIDHLPLEKLRDLVNSMADVEDVKYKLKLVSCNDPYSTLKNKLERIIRKYAEPIGEIEVYDLYAFSEKILEYLEQDIYEVNDLYWQSKVKCICYVLDKLNELNLDDSEEDVWIMYNTCYEMLGTILSKDENRLYWMKGMINPIYFREFIETVNC